MFVRKAGEQAHVAEVLVALAVTVESIEDVGDLPCDLVGEPGLPDEDRGIKGGTALAPRRCREDGRP